MTFCIEDDEAAEEFFREIGIAVASKPVHSRNVTLTHFLYAIVLAAAAVGIFLGLFFGGTR
jgi:hypothetical protein